MFAGCIANTQDISRITELSQPMQAPSRAAPLASPALFMSPQTKTGVNAPSALQGLNLKYRQFGIKPPNPAIDRPESTVARQQTTIRGILELLRIEQQANSCLWSHFSFPFSFQASDILTFA
jgi:hypothetical protein